MERERDSILVNMRCDRHTTQHHVNVDVTYNVRDYKKIVKDRFDIYKKEPLKDISSLCALTRRVVNTDISRLEAIKDIMLEHNRIIIFYNFDYELELLRTLNQYRPCYEYNGHKHEKIPYLEEWLYLVQYSAGAEGWNCTSTNCIVFYSQSYSYKTMIQASGRIDRLNTRYTDLYFYHLMSKSPIDIAIAKCLDDKKDFNEKTYLASLSQEKHML